MIDSYSSRSGTIARLFLATQRAAAEARVNADAKGADSKNTGAGGRTVNDTVTLSDGNKIVNLRLGLDLAEQVRGERDPVKMRSLLASGFEDIKRVGRLFTAVFSGLRGFLFGR